MGLEREPHLLVDDVLQVLERPGRDAPAAGVEEAVLAGDGLAGAAARRVQVLVEEGALVPLGELPGEGGVAGGRGQGPSGVFAVEAVQGRLVIALADVVVGIVDAGPRSA